MENANKSNQDIPNEASERLGNLALRLAKEAIDDKRYEDALKLADDILKGEKDNLEAFEYKGIAHFYMNKFEVAKEAFSEALKLKDGDESLKNWIGKCDLKIEDINKSCGESTADAQKSVLPTMPSGPKTRYDWYQTESQVIVTIMLKNVKKEDCKIQIEEQSLSSCVKLPTGSEHTLELELAHPILPSQSTYKVLSTKIEIKLKKAEGLRWNKLEGADLVCSKTPSVSTAATKPEYPSSSCKKHDWERLECDIKKEEEEDKPEGDAALNNLFQKIYADGTDETKKAMMKSFSESGGTVLSTNWNEVGLKKVDVKPPDGMEYKQWEK